MDYAKTLGQDPERGDEARYFLRNTSVQNFSWSNLFATVQDRQTKEPRDLIHDISGDVKQGTQASLFSISYKDIVRIT